MAVNIPFESVANGAWFSWRNELHSETPAIDRLFNQHPAIEQIARDFFTGMMFRLQRYYPDRQQHNPEGQQDLIQFYLGSKKALQDALNADEKTKNYRTREILSPIIHEAIIRYQIHTGVTGDGILSGIRVFIDKPSNNKDYPPVTPMPQPQVKTIDDVLYDGMVKTYPPINKGRASNN